MSRILYLTPSSVEDFSFIKKCQMEKDFGNNIDESGIKASNIFIINDGSNNIGIFIPNIHKITELTHSRPVIYILKEYRINSSYIICEIVLYLFEVRMVDRVIIQVYSNNIQMVNFMKNLNIPLRGEVNNIRVVDGKKVSMIFYDISVEKYLSIRGNFIE